MNINFEAKKVFITGGSRGIGKTIKQLYKTSGAMVYAPTHKELDLSDINSVNGYLTANRYIEPDIFVHCAGINELADIHEIDQSILTRVFQVNLFSAVSLINQFATGMKARGEGKIVFISSLYAIIARERRIAYSASKNALTGLMKTLALELAPYNIMVNGVAPGYVMTEMTQKNLSAAEIEHIKKAIPTGRFQSETDIANMVLFLTSEMNCSITGQLIAVDGGFTCR